MAQRRILWWVGTPVAAAILFYFFPLFRVTRIERGDTSTDEPSSVALDLDQFADEFWNGSLASAAENALQITSLVEELRSNPEKAQQAHGRQTRLNGPYYFFVQGRGVVLEADGDECLLELPGLEERVALQTGVLIGNAVRDATGLIELSQFSNSRDFNKLSILLNQKAEQTVLEPVRERIVAGAALAFVGCLQLDAVSLEKPLKTVPVRISFEEEGAPQ